LKPSGKEWKSLFPQLKKTYAKGRQAYRTALTESTAEDFHEWRKRAKELLHEIKLLRPICPQKMNLMARDLKILGEHLGNDHDLVILRESRQKQQCARTKVEKKLKLLDQFIVERQHQLRTAAILLGARLYSEKPSMFCERLAGYWHAWKTAAH